MTRLLDIYTGDLGFGSIQLDIPDVPLACVGDMDGYGEYEIV
ncbi:MAG: hypothetical protein ACKVKL_00490 [Pseudomonadales bacterium]